MALSDAVVRQAKTTGKDYTLNDTDGFAVRHRPRGQEVVLPLHLDGQAAARCRWQLSGNVPQGCARAAR